MNKAYIKALSYYLPEHILTNAQIASEFPEWTADKIAAKIGIRERHIATLDETASDLAFLAAKQLFTDDNVDPKSIDFILFCSQSPDYLLPSSACLLQTRLGLSTHCGALDFNLGCSGYEYGLAMAKGLIVSNIAHNVLLLTAETYTKYIHPQDKGNKTIFGDGASATLISTDGFAEIGEFVLGTDGSGGDRLIVKTRGARCVEYANDATIDKDGNVYSSDHLFMDGASIFNFTADIVPTMVDEVLNKHSLLLGDIDLFVFHQANKYMINYLRKLLDIPKEKFYIYMEPVGNTVSSTIPIALCEAQKEDKLHGNILLAGFGVGLSWGATIIKANNHDDE